MKRTVLILVFLLGTLASIAQTKEQIANWLYGLPIKKNATKIKKVILENDYFKEDHRTLSPNFKFLSSTYKGTIVKPYLPRQGHLDSAKIELAVGTLESKGGYSGDMKWLRFEYFSSDTIFLNELFDTACSELKPGSKQERPTGFRRKDDVIGNGKEFFYIYDYYTLRSVSVLRVRYKTGIQSFSIHYSGSND